MLEEMGALPAGAFAGVRAPRPRSEWRALSTNQWDELSRSLMQINLIYLAHFEEEGARETASEGKKRLEAGQILHCKSLVMSRPVGAGATASAGSLVVACRSWDIRAGNPRALDTRHDDTTRRGELLAVWSAVAKQK